MDNKKRKVEENGAPPLTSDDVRKIIDPFSKEQLLEILQAAAVSHEDVLENVRKIADLEPSKRKLFVRGLGTDLTSEALQKAFSQYGEITEAVAITDGRTGKGKGYGFVTFVHIDGAIRALKEPNKKIDGRNITANLAATGPPGIGAIVDQAGRKLFVGHVPYGIDGEKLRSVFSQFGELDEGPIGLEKVRPNTQGFVYFVYKSVDGMKRALEEPVKSIDGHYLYCKPHADKNKVEGAMTENVDFSAVNAAANAAYQNALGLGQTLGSSARPGLNSLSPSVPQLGLGGSSLNLSHPSSYGASLAYESYQQAPAYDSYRSLQHHDIGAQTLGNSGLGDYPSTVGGPRSGYASSLGTSLYGAQASSQALVSGDPNRPSPLQDYPRAAGARFEEYSRAAGARLEDYPRAAGGRLEEYSRGAGARLEEYSRGAGARLEDYPRGAGARLEDYPRAAGARLEDYPRGSGARLEDYPHAAGARLEDYPHAAGARLQSLRSYHSP